MSYQEQRSWSPEEEIEDFHLFEEWLRHKALKLVQPERGDILQGTIVHISPTEILVDIGAKRDGFVPSTDIQRLPRTMRESLAIGQEVPVIVIRVYEDTGDIELSISRALQQQDWLKAKELQESKDIVEVEVTGYNRGGLTVNFGQIRGFIPLSHVADMPRNLSPEERTQRMAAMVGQRIPVSVIEVDRGRRRLIFSHREGVQHLREKRKEELLTTLQEGEIVKGRVRRVTDFGVFVDLGGVDGLIHRSELAWEPIQHPQDVLEVGEEVEVKVIKIDKEKRRIGLSLKRMHPNPWEKRVSQYAVGDIVQAIITNVTDFGAFASLEPGIEGLIHKSEIGLASGETPRDVLQPGTEVNVRILDIDHENQRISLSIRRAPQWEESESEEDESEELNAVPTEDVDTTSILSPDDEGQPDYMDESSSDEGGG